MYNTVLLEQFSPSSECWQYLIRKKKIQDLTVEEVVKSYQGFEGELISIFSSDVEIVNVEAYINLEVNVNGFDNRRLIYVVSEPEVPPSLLKKQPVFMGYDVGVCDEEKTIYSSIFNEVIFGNLVDLVNFKKFLNKNLLFPESLFAIEYVEMHDQLSAQGKDVEDYEKMVIYEIWKYL